MIPEEKLLIGIYWLRNTEDAALRQDPPYCLHCQERIDPFACRTVFLREIAGGGYRENLVAPVCPHCGQRAIATDVILN